LNLWVVLPTYNEAENLAPIVDMLLALEIAAPPQLRPAPAAPGSWRAIAPHQPVGGDHEEDGSADLAIHTRWIEPFIVDGPARISVLIVDDNSPDGTGLIADELARAYPDQVHVLHRPAKLGLGSAYLEGFAFVLDHGADVVVQMDADFSHSPAYLPPMIGMLRDYDVVVGSRWVPGGRLDEQWERWRYLLSRYANLYARWMTGLHVRDTTAGFKVFRAQALRQLPLGRIRSGGYAFQIEVAVACQRLGLRVAELPIYFEERVRGRSKMSWAIILEAVWRLWQIRFG